MKAVILAGGYGSRLGSLTDIIPKPMIEIGGRPILWHIMKIYSSYGINEFVICGGYKVEKIKDYFLHYRNQMQDYTIDFSNNSIVYHGQANEQKWKVTVADTGEKTLKGGRIKKINKYLDDDTNFLTYGDGVADVDINKLLEFHKEKGKILTITGVRPPSQFGEIELDGDEVKEFKEKAQISQGIINGGFMVFNRKLMDYLTAGEDCDFEFGPLARLTERREVAVYLHTGQWACMDTERDRKYLNALWLEDKAFWKKWIE